MREYIPQISKLLNGVLDGLPFLLPEFILATTFLLSIFSGISKGQSKVTWWLSVTGIVAAGLAAVLQSSSPAAGPVFFEMILPDANGALLKVLIGFVCLLFCIFVYHNQPLRNHPKKMDDLLSVLLAVHIGLNLMAIAVNWLMVYITIEMVSIGSYVMVAYLSRDNKQSEAAVKYVLFGTVCSAIMLYGLSFFYGYTGSLSFVDARHLTGLLAMPAPVFMLATLLVLTGIGFKLSFVPFHFWSPDVYQGAPTPVTAFLSTAPKIGAIVLLGRFVLSWPQTLDTAIPRPLFYLLAVIAMASMLVGNLVAIRQNNMKRMMAYSSIGHTGFLVMIILADVERSFPILFFFLASYVIMNMGVFMLADYLEEKLGLTEISQYRGLGKSHPAVMVALTILMVSLIGLPPTAGFVAKLLTFSAVLTAYQAEADLVWLLLAVTGAITTVVALFFYFKIPLQAFLRSAAEQSEQKAPLNALLITAFLLCLLTVLFGIFPAVVLDLL
ncbi:NADH-quinone oxidoreductase subunit N [Olivibacter sp. XZL3]|uniref:NADH-quinone oxidoreductase subunit N n=1 Tax=Olivibacter sp. XZL3 TaxID=1735116 RepID=UPI001065D445|nr:NADH-quinone oxidoreductase subunit N [Olivibacter sp. XZL3]